MTMLSKKSGLFRWFIPCCLLIAVAAAAADDNGKAASDADSDADAGEYFKLENCVDTSRIRRTSIIDDRTIVFYMNQKKIFVNHLPYRCPGLKIAGTFSYRTSISQLCNVDTIKVIRSMGGRIDAGPSCGLGKFRPVTEEEVAMLRNKEIAPVPEEEESAETENTDEEQSDAH